MTVCFNKSWGAGPDCGPAVYQVTVSHNDPADEGPEGPVTLSLCVRCTAEWRQAEAVSPGRNTTLQFRSIPEKEGTSWTH